MKPTKANFCTPVRNAIVSAGFSSVKALNVVNSELGKMSLVKSGEDKTGDVKVKIPKSENLDATTSVSVKPGTETYEMKGTTAALTFAAWNDAIAKAEKYAPSMQVIIPEGSAFHEWLGKIAKPEPAKTEPAKV